MSYYSIVRHYERCLGEHGGGHLAVDWPNQEDADKRYEVMIGVIKPAGVWYSEQPLKTVLDFGCGVSGLREWLERKGVWPYGHIHYEGLDISPAFVAKCRELYPSITYHCVDILTDPERVSEFDYVLMNGVLTEKRSLSWKEMWDYARQLLKAAWNITKVGLAFNVMSTHVDWQRNDLFHLPMDEAAHFISGNLSRKFTFRQDYGLYEYTAYVYK